MRNPFRRQPPPPPRPIEPGGSYGGTAVEDGPYELAQDRYRSRPAYSEPYPAGPGKRVRTTIGRARPPQPYPYPTVDPNARMASALRPGIAPAAQVRALDQGHGEPDVRPRRPDPILCLRPLIAREPPARRWLFAVLALTASATFLVAMLQFWAPASATPQAHGPLLAGRLLAEQGSMRLAPDDPFSFVGEAWVPTGRVAIAPGGAAVQEYYPRDPAGLPLLYGVLFRLAGTPEQALHWAHLVNPAAAALAVLGMFYLGRFAGGSFLGMLAMVAMATSPVVLLLATDAAGHATSAALIVWGFFALLAWWRRGNALVGLLAGLLLGLSVTVSYGNALLAVPLICACVFAWHWRRPLSSAVTIFIPLLAFALPVAGLLYWNHRETGALTGYHLGGEVVTLDPQNILQSWQTLMRHVMDAGLYFLVPLGVIGLLALLARRLPLGLVIAAWLAVPLVAFMALLASPTREQSLPLLLIVLPVLLFGTTYLLRRVLYAPGDAPPQILVMQDPYTGQPVHMLAEQQTPFWRTLAAPIAAGLVVAAVVAVGVTGVVSTAAAGETLVQRHQRLTNLAMLNGFVHGHVAPPATAEPGAGGAGEGRRPVLFVDVTLEGGRAAYQLDLLGELELYESEAFSLRHARRFSSPWNASADDASHTRISPRRHEYLGFLYEGMTEADMSERVRAITDRALEDGRGVYLLMSGVEARRFEQAHLLRGYEARTLATFLERPLAFLDLATESPPRTAEWVLVRVSREPELVSPGAVVHIPGAAY